jgi:hypothetical protein
MKAYRKTEEQFHAVVTSAPEEWAALRHGRLPAVQELAEPTEREVGWVPEPDRTLWERGNYLAPTGNPALILWLSSP